MRLKAKETSTEEQPTYKTGTEGAEDVFFCGAG
jgi:hypothetical protein